jgi:hypothetical protein
VKERGSAFPAKKRGITRLAHGGLVTPSSRLVAPGVDAAATIARQMRCTVAAGLLFLAALTASVLAHELLEQLAGGRPTFSSSSPNPIGRLGSRPVTEIPVALH